MSLTGSAESNLLLRGKLTKIPSVDTTLTKEGECAEAKATGDAIENARELANKAQTTANSALSQVNTHTADKNNPHGVTLAQVGGSNPNLLDNWYFADPIDQRGGYIIPAGTAYYSDVALSNKLGTTSGAYQAVTYGDSTYCYWVQSGVTYYCATADAVRGYVGVGYTIDRWWENDGATVVTEKGINIKESVSSYGYTQFEQTLDEFDHLLNQAITLSVLTSEGLTTSTRKLTSGYENNPYAYFGSNGSYCRAVFLDSNSKLYVQFISVSDNDPDIIAVKLELGSTQTLAHQDANGNWVLNDPPPNKDLELLKCCMSTADSSDTYANNTRTATQVGAAALAQGESIPANTDLDTLTTFGNYKCTNGSTVATLANCPVTTAFVMQVGSSAPGVTNYFYQLIRTIKDNWFYRSSRNSSGAVAWNAWVHFATTDYAVNKAGDTMTGTLNVANGQGATVMVTNDGASAMLGAYTSGGWSNRRFIQIPTVNSTQGYTNLDYVGTGSDSFRHHILHTGNKPSGSYTGNGDATSRTINTGGIGDAVLITGNGSSWFVSKNGAVGKSSASSTSASALAASACSFASGVITIATADAGVNASNATYYYQVL